MDPVAEATRKMGTVRSDFRMVLRLLLAALIILAAILGICAKGWYNSAQTNSRQSSALNVLRSGNSAAEVTNCLQTRQIAGLQQLNTEFEAGLTQLFIDAIAKHQSLVAADALALSHLLREPLPHVAACPTSGGS